MKILGSDFEAGFSQKLTSMEKTKSNSSRTNRTSKLKKRQQQEQKEVPEVPEMTPLYQLKKYAVKPSVELKQKRLRARMTI